MDQLTGKIFDIQHFSIHDGPGIRTTVFLKGCPLTCLWCQNPESHKKDVQIMVSPNLCIGCGKCLAECMHEALSLKESKISIDREKCTACGACAAVCRQKAITLVGEEYSPQEVLDDVKSDIAFYKNSGGGVTLSGGEVLMQADFSTELLKLCREAGISTAIETTCYANWEKVKQIVDQTDLVLLDLKHMDSDTHKRLTGVPNELILENAKKIKSELDKPIWARIPVIPGQNDSDENITATAEFVSTYLGNETQVHLLPYHNMGEGKKEMLGYNNFTDFATPSDEHLEHLKSLMEEKNLKVFIGG